MKTTIDMAREAGLLTWLKPPEDVIERFKAFADLVRADEREACAKVADGISEDQWALYKGRPPYTGQELERASEYTQGKSDGAEVCAAAIRARGQA
jgi:hypothetical protein